MPGIFISLAISFLLFLYAPVDLYLSLIHIFALAEKEDKIRAYYIGEKRLITLMMKMDAEIGRAHV